MARRDKDKQKEADAKSDTAEKSDATPKSEKPDPERDAQAESARPDPNELPAIDPPDPKAEPWPDATPPPMRPVESPKRAETARGVEAPHLRASRTPTATMAMPPITDVGRPPEMPSSAAPPPLALGSVEDPTHMPGPKDVPAGSPDDPAPPPGRVPPGDSRSLRRGNEFALVYRVGSCVITRVGVVGTRGQWRVVEYPTSASAGSSYAKECSRFVSEGFSDYRA